MKAFVKKIVLAVLVSLGATHMAPAGEAHFLSAGTYGVGDSWILTVPAGTFAHAYVVAQVGGIYYSSYAFYQAELNVTNLDPYERIVSSGYTYKETGGWPGDYASGSASIQAGIAGPPSGQVYLALATTSGAGSIHATDEKWATLVGGTYQIWHGGGTSGGGLVTAETDLTW